jgi:hypothetical protein
MKKLLCSITIVLLIASCKLSSPHEDELIPPIPVPEVTDDGWEVASLNSVGMDAVKFSQLLNRLEQIGEHRIHSIIVVRNNKLVFEQYCPGLKFNLGQYTGATGYDMNDLHVLCSATKSVTSALLGIAIDKGYVQSIEQKVMIFSLSMPIF